VHDSHFTFGRRLGLAWSSFFRALFSPAWAQHCLSAPAPSDPPPRAPLPPKTAEAPTAALQLLGILQREGRLVDFAQQDVAGFSDAEIGAAARVVHEGVRRSLLRLGTWERIREEAEGTRITLEAGFDGRAHKLLGAVPNAPPYSGILRHPGWRVTRFELEECLDQDALRVIAPAEVEL